MSRLSAFVLFAVMLVLIWPVGAAAQYSAENQAAQNQLMAQQTEVFETLNELRAELEAQPREQWTDAQLDAYYRAALANIDARIRREALSGFGMPYILDAMPGDYAGKYWAGDPLNNWQPLRICNLGDPPVPGGIVYQTCPAEYCSLSRYYISLAFISSYELSIYGLDAASDPSAQPQSGNAAWAVVPPGTLAMLGYHSPSIREMAEPWDDVGAILKNARQLVELHDEAIAYYREHVSTPKTPGMTALQITMESLESVLGRQRELERLVQALREHPGEPMDSRMLEKYLSEVQWQVYMAAQANSHCWSGWSFDPQLLKERGFLPEIPLNPCNNWQPVQVRDISAGFHAGDIFIQWCPSILFSSILTGPAPETFNSGIFSWSPDVTVAQLGRMPENSEWTVIPPGALLILSGYRQSLLRSDFNRAVCHS